MATPMSADELLAVLEAEGLKVVQYTGWRDRCRCHSGPHSKGGLRVRAWGPINGTMVHITAGNLNGRTVEQYIASIIDGDPALPDKAQMVVAPNGTVYLNSAGRSNHAGEISSRSLAKAADGSFSLAGYDDERGSGTDGNSHFYGIENIAAKDMTDAQYDASVKICAAIARHYGWSGRETVGHGECSSARSFADPNLNMGAMRKDVMARVKAGAGVPAPDPVVVSPPPAEPVAELTVRTLNCAAKAKAWQRSTFDGRLPHIKSQLSAGHTAMTAGAAIVCLQEAGSAAYVAKLGSKVVGPLGYRWTPGGRNWRYLIYDPKQVSCVRGGAFYLGFPGKYAAWGLYRELETGKELFVVSTHLMQGWLSTDEERQREALSMNRQIRKANTSKAPVVVAGDFNSYTLVGETVMKPAGFKDSIDIADVVADAQFNSFNGRKSVAVPKEPDVGGLHDDHIYVESGIDVVRWDQNVNLAASDHNSVAARIRY